MCPHNESNAERHAETRHTVLSEDVRDRTLLKLYRLQKERHKANTNKILIIEYTQKFIFLFEIMVIQIRQIKSRKSKTLTDRVVLESDAWIVRRIGPHQIHRQALVALLRRLRFLQKIISIISKNV